MRRGFWRVGSGATALEREIAFDAVIEPEDLAELVDRGPTTKQRSRTIRVGADQAAGRGRAADAGGGPAARSTCRRDGFCVLIQLGAGNNFDFSAVQERILARLGAIPELRRWRCSIRRSATGRCRSEAGVRILRQFPSSRYLHAFDCVVSAVGYNSFHELVLSGTPSLFVPNEHPMMDDQRARAEHAERMGWSLAARTVEIYRLSEKLERLLDPEERARHAPRHGRAAASQRSGRGRARPGRDVADRASRPARG